MRAILMKKKPSGIDLLPILLLSFAVTLLACDHDKDVRQVGAQTTAASPAAETPLPKLSLPPDAGPAATIDSTRAFQYLKEIVALDRARWAAQIIRRWKTISSRTSKATR